MINILEELTQSGSKDSEASIKYQPMGILIQFEKQKLKLIKTFLQLFCQLFIQYTKHYNLKVQLFLFPQI